MLRVVGGDLGDTHDRGEALAECRNLARFLKRLRKQPSFDDSRVMQKVYARYYRRLVLLRDRVKIFFPPPEKPRAAPLDILQRVYDHHRDFRFEPRHLDQIATALLPEKVNGTYGCAAPRVVALGVLLRHLAFPERQDRQAEFWCRSEAWVSSIFHAVLQRLYHLAQRVFRRWTALHFNSIPDSCAAMLEKSSHLLYVHALLDGSGLAICRPSPGPGREQQEYYSGNERLHVLRILGLVSLSGMFVRVFGSYAGSAADETIYRLEDMETQLDELHNRAIAAFQMPMRPRIATDSGLPTTVNVATPFEYDPDANGMTFETIYSIVHSRMRVPNEWGFGRVVNLFQCLQHKLALKAGWTEPEKQYIVGLLMTNLVVCCEGSQAETYFGIRPPELHEYLNELLK